MIVNWITSGVVAGDAVRRTLLGMARLRLFASAREAAGTGRDVVEGATVAEVLAVATARYGDTFAALLPRCRVWVNGVELDETYLHGDTTDCQPRACDPVVVPEGSVFVLGDNRAHSSDSRYFGPVKISNIVGKAWITYWPIGHIGAVPTADYDELDNTGN